MEVREYGERKGEVKGWDSCKRGRMGFLQESKDGITHMMNFDRYSCTPLSVVENTSCAVNYKLCLVA